MKQGQLITLRIESLNSEGEGVAHCDGLTIFVSGALPQEEVLAQIFLRKRNYAKAEMVRPLAPSPFRMTPPCAVFGRCGGCPLMHLSYEEQLQAKSDRVRDALQRIGSFREIEVPLCRPSPHSLGYRNKMQTAIFQGKQGIELGFYARRSHEGVPIEECLIHCPLGEQVFRVVKEKIQRAGLAIYDPKKKRGVWRHLLMKTAAGSQKVLVTLVTGPTPSHFLQSFAEELLDRCPEIQGVLQNINASDTNAILGKTWRTLAGTPFLEETMNGLTFFLSAPSFFQVNPLQAEAVYQWAREAAALTASDSVLDAYCGIGTLSLFAARQCRDVVGIECVPEAIGDAQKNAERNGIQNAVFHCGMVEEKISAFAPFDAVFLNPPRKGCEENVLDALGSNPPKRIVYISCNPATLARDAAILHRHGFELVSVQPFDMFPQTPHVETVALFHRR